MVFLLIKRLTSSYANYNIVFVMDQNCRQDIIYLIKHLSKLLEADFDQRVSKIGLTAPQARLLFFIIRKTKIENIEVHQNDIEKEFSLAKSTVNGLVSRLLKTGYINKDVVQRYSILKPTDEGIKAADSIKHGRIETIDKLFQGYSEEEKSATLEKLNILINNLEGRESND